jgi:tetratricopeptide repeat protein 12
MSALETDAKERAEHRRQQKQIADEWKVKGNEAFHRQSYEQAIDYYTQVSSNIEHCFTLLDYFLLLLIYFSFVQGLHAKKDYDILYTNRAQVYVKQGRYNDAIDDCDWALKVRISHVYDHV